MIRKLLPFLTFVAVLARLPIINHNCNFPTLNTCLRVDPRNKMNFFKMKKECEKFDLTMMPAEKEFFGKLKTILLYRYDSMTQFPFGIHVSDVPYAIRDRIEKETGLKIKNPYTIGWLVYNYLENNLAIVPLETELPIACWTTFKPRLKCPADFKLIYPRLTCYGVITKDQVTPKWTNDQCENECRRQNSNLGAFHSQQEQIDFVEKLGLEWKGSLWIGTRFPHNANQNKGKDKIAVRKTAYNMDGSVWTKFENAFEDDEPNAYGGISENCIEWRLYRGKTKSYNDLRCDKKLEGCVCESAPDQSNGQYKLK
uniref:C-type lectin domain-containing protein n=1 Tax=Panagrellus redivivus TaxID=6233 RepID=A0A7E4ZZW7_PANRE